MKIKQQTTYNYYYIIKHFLNHYYKFSKLHTVLKKKTFYFTTVLLRKAFFRQKNWRFLRLRKKRPLFFITIKSFIKKKIWKKPWNPFWLPWFLCLKTEFFFPNFVLINFNILTAIVSNIFTNKTFSQNKHLFLFKLRYQNSLKRYYL